MNRKYRHKSRLLMVCAVVTVVVAAGCSSAPPKEETRLDTQAAEYPEAVALYKKSCISCHAADLQGRVGPNLQQAGSKFTADELANLISEGKGGMPAYKKSLNAEEIQALAEWLAQQK